MARMLKRFFTTLLLGPLFPILSVPEGGEGGDAGGNSDSGDSGNDDGNKDDGDAGNDSGEGNKDDDKGGQVIFQSQEEFDKVIERRIAKAIRKAKEEVETQKKKDNMTEVERLKVEKQEAEKAAAERAAASDKKLIKAEVISQSTKLKIIDSDAAFALIPKDDIDVLDDGTVTGVEKALKVLIKTKPWLISDGEAPPKRGGDDQNSGAGKKNKFSMNALIRKAAGLE